MSRTTSRFCVFGLLRPSEPPLPVELGCCVFGLRLLTAVRVGDTMFCGGDSIISGDGTFGGPFVGGDDTFVGGDDPICGELFIPEIVLVEFFTSNLCSFSQS